MKSPDSNGPSGPSHPEELPGVVSLVTINRTFKGKTLFSWLVIFQVSVRGKNKIFTRFFYTAVNSQVYPAITCQHIERQLQEIRTTSMNKRERNQDATVYVGNLDENVTQSLLYELFIQVAPVVSVHLPQDRILKTHQGYGFIELKTVKDVEYVEKVMSGVKLFNKSLKVNKVSNNSKKNGAGDDIDVGSTLFIKNLDQLVDENQLVSIFKQFGAFAKPPTLVRSQDKDTNTAFVYFKTFKQSDDALSKMQNQFVLNKKIQIDYAYKKTNNGQKIKHGDQIDRLLQSQAAKNSYSF